MKLLTAWLHASKIRSYWRPLILIGAGVFLVVTFWVSSRYPQLSSKAERVGEALPTMAFSNQVLESTVDDPAWWQILASSINWLEGMKIGMTFGVLLGALLHTILRYYPLKIGNNLYLNSLKGALIGVPMGVCANCAVPTACGVTRGHGRVEVALGFLFSSPNFNPVVVTMTFMALPLGMVITKYAILLLLIAVIVPSLIRFLERKQPLQVVTADEDAGACAIDLPDGDCGQPFFAAFVELAREYRKNVWMLLKPTITLMLLASVAAATMLVLIPWDTLLSGENPLQLAIVSMCSVFMPVPIALDVLFAAHLQAQGVHSGYVMLFLMTLGTYSIIPAVYLWREVSKTLAATLFAFFLATGFTLGLLF
jgi:uncharacterized membrane protein YraQ (UPF0718 family)